MRDRSGKPAVAGVERQFEPDQAFAARHRPRTPRSRRGVRLRSMPHSETRRPPCVGDAACRGAPGVAIDRRVPDRQRRRQAPQLESEVRQCHAISSPASPPPGDTRRRGRAGCTGPASARAPRCTNTGISAGGCASGLTLVSPNTIGCTRLKTDANARPERDQQERRRPGLLAHGGGDDQELAGEDAERRHAQDGQRAEHQAPGRPSG